MSPARAGAQRASQMATAAPKRRPASIALGLQRTLQLRLVHLRAPGDVSPLGLLIQLGLALAALGPRPRGLPGSLPLLRSLQWPPVLGGGLLVGAAGLVQGDRDGLARVADLLAAAALEFTMFELVHDPADDLFLLRVL